jgi:hypothetical protein
MKINEIINEGVGSLIGRGLSKLGSAIRGGARPSVPNVPPPPSAPAIRPSNIPKKQWKQMTPAQRQSVSGASQPPSAVPSAPVAQQAPSSVTKEPGILSKAGSFAARHPIYTAAGGTMAYHLAGEEDPFSPEAFGSAARKTVGTAARVAKGFVGSGDRADTATASQEPSSDSTGTAALPQTPTGEPQSSAEPSVQDADSDYLDKIRRDQDERYGRWGKEANESVKKKTQVALEGTLDDIIAWSDAKNKKSTTPQRTTSIPKFASDEEKLKAIQRSIYGQESGYGRAKTDKPNYAGARGPMQIMPATWQDMKNRGLIPKDYDIKNPEHNQAGGNALIADYYTRYSGDPAKIYAAYYAGPGAINKDGTINTQWRDKKNPKAPSVGEYIAQASSKLATPIGVGAGTALAASDSKPATKTVASTQAALPQASEPKPETLGSKLEKIVEPKPRYYRRGELSIDQYMQKSQEELDKLRAAARRPLPQEPTTVKPEPNKPESLLPGQEANAIPAAGAVEPKTNSGTTEKETVKVPESVNMQTNNDLFEILRLAGKK